MPSKIFPFNAASPEFHPRQGQSLSGPWFPALRVAIVTTLLLLALSFPAMSAPSMAPRNVLILLSGQYGLPAYDVLMHEVRATLNARFPGPLNYYAEYLDVVRFPSIQETQLFLDFHRQKYKGLKIDLVIAIGPNLVPIIKRFGDQLFRSSPVVILDLLSPEAELPAVFRKPNMTGVFPALDTRRLIKTALSLHPDTEHLAVVSGESDMDRMLGALALKECRLYKDTISVQHIGGMPMTDILRSVRALPDRSVVLLMGLHRDANGVAYYGRESAQLIAAVSGAPCYVFWDAHVDVGVVGGHVLSLKTIGIRVGEFASRILHGEDPAAIPLLREGLYQHQFDWRQLDRWGVPEEYLPAGSLVLNRQPTFFEQYFWLVMGVLVFVALQSTLIAYLVILNRRQRGLSQELRRAENRYRELLRIERSTRLNEMAGSLAHELRQPLAAILSSAQAALRFLKTGPMNPELLREILQHIVADDKRAASIIGNMRAMLKKGPADRELLDVNDMVAEVVTIFRGEAINRGVRIETDLDRGFWRVSASKTQMLQVFLNLMINAAQAMSLNSDENRRMILATRPSGPNVVISVQDVGTGIDPDQLDHLFEPFFTNRNEGLGMGLAVCRTIVEDHGGHIRAENNPDRGATFTIELEAVNNG